MPNQIQTPQTSMSQAAPRRQRVSAAVIAQYIQDLTQSEQPLPCRA